MRRDAELVYPRKPPCTHCGSRETADHGRKGKERYQRRRCLTCNKTFHAFPIWIVWRQRHIHVLGVDRPREIQATKTATPLNKPEKTA